MAFYAGITQHPPKTMIADLEPAAVLFKSIATAMRLTTATPNPLHPQETKIAPNLCWKQLNHGHQHPNTQLYMVHYDASMPAATSHHHEPTLSITPAQHPTTHHLQSRSLNKMKTSVILISMEGLPHWSYNDKLSSGTRMTHPAAQSKFPSRLDHIVNPKDTIPVHQKN